jgi:hypothetical protein
MQAPPADTIAARFHACITPMKRLATIIRPHDAAGVVLGLGLGGLGGANRATRVIGGLAANALRRSPRANL